MTGLLQIARLVHLCEKIEGRVKLQKIVHILQEAGHPFSEEFGYLHHGPYSSELKREIDQLVEWNLIEESAEEVIDFTQYTYARTQSLDEMLEAVEADDVPDWGKLARDLERKSSQELEAISTIMFLRRRGFEGDKLETRFGELKPHLVGHFENCHQKACELQDPSGISKAEAG